jgi:hypothetical protein
MDAVIHNADVYTGPPVLVKQSNRSLQVGCSPVDTATANAPIKT